jgi:hypothetical protein
LHLLIQLLTPNTVIYFLQCTKCQNPSAPQIKKFPYFEDKKCEHKGS